MFNNLRTIGLSFILCAVFLSLDLNSSHTEDNGSFYLVLNSLKPKDLKSCRLVSYSWRCCVDIFLQERHKASNKTGPVLRQLEEENDFFRLVSISDGQTAYESGQLSKAFKSFSQAAYYQRGNAKAIYIIGHMYLLGEGITKSLREGLYQLNRAAQAGYAPANYDLGFIYHTGLDAKGRKLVPVDYAQAFNYYMRAHELGHAGATYHLGVLYYNGLYVAKNTQRAQALIKQAADGGYQLAKERLLRFEQKQPQ